tara:strand:- start:212 stop:1276 length:1065 start_codon:yes stop_codon:yes gene_type:complete
MKVKSELLPQTLLTNKYSAFWISGDEPLLVQESADFVRQHFRKNGFEEREVFNVDSDFNLERFTNSVNNLSLFSTNKIIELRLDKVNGKNGSADKLKLGQDEKTAIDTFLINNNPDLALIITSVKIDRAVLSSKWFKTYESLLALIQVWPIDSRGLVKWLSQELRNSGINADNQALQILSEKVEGNLLAAKQEIEKLKLLANLDGKSQITLDTKTVMQVVANNSRFDIYDLIDTALLGDSERCQKMIANFKEEGTYPLLVLNALTRELRILNNMILNKESGQRLNSILQTSRVFFNRKQAVTNAINRLSSNHIWRMLDKALQIDKAIKGASFSNPWDEINILVLELSGEKRFNS